MAAGLYSRLALPEPRDLRLGHAVTIPSARSEEVKQTACGFCRVWEQLLAQSEGNTAARKDELAGVERKMRQLLDRIIDADSETLIKAYEDRIKDLEV